MKISNTKGRAAGMTLPLPILYVMLLLSAAGCAREETSLFTLLDSSETNITFFNALEDTPEFNILNYLYFYDGGGVAVGDLNNNGLPDIFFVGNEVKNKLYLNKGDFRFEDITESAGVGGDEGAWSTGVTMADINGNGYLDIYICRVNYHTKEGANQLFINNGNLTFTEKAEEFGLDFRGYSTQAVFFDYNNNGRLDMFLLNHSFHSSNTYGEAETLRRIEDPRAGDRLFRNDGGTFTDVTLESGIISSALGYGLGVAVSDINKNGWPDIYVGNDFHEDDYLYINNGDGTFTEALYSSIGHTSSSSMGNDIADINNNGYVDIVSLDMMPDDHETYMRSGGPDIELIARTKKEFGFGEKNARNTLQVNRGLSPDDIPIFSETAFSSGIARTDWSWAALLMDIDNSGYKDLFVTNGMVRRPNDLDFVRVIRDIRSRQSGETVSNEEFESIQMMPELLIPNYIFRNNGDLSFQDVTTDWGVDQPSFSSGAAYADLNGNGLLDLVVSNNNMPVFIYRNNGIQQDSIRNYLRVKLNGYGLNTSGIGTKVILYQGDQIYYQENFPTRGFQSSVEHILHFGLGDESYVDSLLVVWPDKSFESIPDVKSNQLLNLYQDDAAGEFDYSNLHRSHENSIFTDVSDKIGIDYKHEENNFNDFHREPLVPYKLSVMGPALAVGDVTGNGLDDFYIGGSHGQAGKLYIQDSEGAFNTFGEDVFAGDASSEDVSAIFFDATGNDLPDLYVVSGGSEMTGQANELRDRLYINTGNGRFEKSDDRLPEIYQNGSVAVAGDFNGNGDNDLFIGGRSIPWAYGELPRSYILLNDGSGRFTDATSEIASIIEDIGMVTDAGFADLTGDGYPELIVVGEWMPVTVLSFQENGLRDITTELGIEQSSGLWQSVLAEDLTGNGYPDIVAGNIGTNTRIDANPEAPFRLYVNDFDGNGQTTGIITRYRNGDYYAFEQLDELLLEFPDLGRQVGSYGKYSTSTIRDLFGDELVDNALVKRDLTEMKSVLYLNDGNGHFEKRYLPFEAQTYPVKAIYSLSSSGETGQSDLLVGGNLYDVKPSSGGRQDAGHGTFIRMDANAELATLDMQNSGFYAPGEIRNIRTIHTVNGNMIMIARNNEKIIFLLER